MDVLGIVKGVVAKAGAKAAPVIFNCRKHAPEILVCVGTVSVASGTVLACVTTAKAKDVMEEEIDEVDEDVAKNIAVKRTAKVVVSYLPAVGLIGGGVAMLISAKSIEHRRLTAALGAYSSLQSMFEAYRERVADVNGVDVEQMLYEGSRFEQCTVMEEQEEGKKPKKAKMDLKLREWEDPFHRIFDECNSPSCFSDNLGENKFFLECWQNRFNQKLNANGRVFLSEVYDALGFDYHPAGRFVGWLASDVEGCKDGYIDFGIDYAYMKDEVTAALDAGRSPEPAIWLNFNCDGEVWSSDLKKRHDI